MPRMPRIPGHAPLGSIHLPWPAGSRRGRPRGRRLRPAVLAVAVVAALTGATVTTHSAAYAATGAPLRRHRGGGARHRVRGELRHRRAGRGLQRHLDQRHRQQLPLQRRRPRGHHRHLAHHRRRQRLRPGLDRRRAVVQLHRQRRHRGHLHRRHCGWPRPTAVTDALHIANSSGTNLCGASHVPATGGYQNWTTVIATVTLPAGTQTLTVDQDNDGWNIHYIAFG